MMASFMLWTRRLLQIALSFKTHFQSTANGSVPPFLFPLAHCAWRQCHKEKENLICTQFKFLKLLKCERELSQVVNYQYHITRKMYIVTRRNSFELNCPIEKVNWYLSRVKVNYDKVKVNYSKLKVNFMCKSLSCGASKLSQE